MENINDSESDYSDIDEPIEKTYLKLTFLRKLGELANRGVQLDKQYSINDTLEELECSYKLYVKIFQYKIYESEVKQIKKYLNENTEEECVKKYMETGIVCYKLIDVNISKYVVINEIDVWNKFTRILLHFLRSEIFKKLLDMFTNWISTKNNSMSETFIHTLKESIINNPQEFSNMKKYIMDKNYRLICEIKNDNEIEATNRQEIITLLIKINGLIAQMKETTNELLEQIENNFGSSDQITKFINEFKIFILMNYEFIVKNDVFYYKYIIEELKTNILSSK
jgi:hypothetical protein